MAVDRQNSADESEAVSVESSSYDMAVSSADENESSSFGYDSVTAHQKHCLCFQKLSPFTRSKLFAYVGLLLAAIAVGSTVFVFMSRDEESDFENEFAILSKDIISSTETCISKVAGVVDGLAVAVTSHILASDYVNEGCFVVPHFELRTREARELSGAEAIGIAPDIHDQNLQESLTCMAEKQGWIKEGLHYRGLDTVDPGRIPTTIQAPDIDYSEHDANHFVSSVQENIYTPMWQIGPCPTNASGVLQDLSRTDWFRAALHASRTLRTTAVSAIVDAHFITKHSLGEQTLISRQPQSVVVSPFYRSFEREAVAEGSLFAVLSWETCFQNALPDGKDGLIVVIDDGCGSSFSFEIDGGEPVFLGFGDHHDPDYHGQESKLTSFGAGKPIDFHEMLKPQIGSNGFNGCQYTISVYPSSEFDDSFDSTAPVLCSLAVVLVFVVAVVVFLVFDFKVYQRQREVQSRAEKTTAIVSNLFPKMVTERILQEASTEDLHNSFGFGTNKKSIKDFLDNGGDGGHTDILNTKPIADLFPAVTIMFADMVGFTAWSSAREPAQVFMLLETVYHAFDEIAERRRVYKVETVGDCYVAVCGLPNPRQDHAVVMAKFACSCLSKMKSLTRTLEETLGPDTTDLSLRIGLHSGPVTAGVLRGERARFQLFGDTVNTTSRMESTGQPGKIQISQETADLLKEAGKAKWCHLRLDRVIAKGKGELTTFWLRIKRDQSGCACSDGSSILCSTIQGGSIAEADKENQSDSESDNGSDDDKENNQKKEDVEHQRRRKMQALMAEGSDSVTSLSTLSLTLVKNDKVARLVNWNTEVLATVLKQVVGRRKAVGTRPDDIEKMKILELTKKNCGGRPLDEVEEIIVLPHFDSSAIKCPESAELSEKVMNQLNAYVATVAGLYRDNPFHNFEHVSHVVMSVVKLLGRIVSPEIEHTNVPSQRMLHDHTYGITSDPLTQFAVVFSALIHDIDHAGVSNAQLVKEETSVAAKYKNQSVAEQNSVDIAWDLLMHSDFDDLRAAIHPTEAEFRRFRQLVVNSVLATDVIDKDLNAARKARWEKAFADKSDTASSYEDVNRKATIVIEHILQASDVAHTMQHWNVYRKWNTRLFEELRKAYEEGRADRDPAEFWYEGELNFFDYYVIPLAKKLKECGVFGVSSDEYLIYATKNRKEWELTGKDIVEDLRGRLRNSIAMRRLTAQRASRRLVVE